MQEIISAQKNGSVKIFWVTPYPKVFDSGEMFHPLKFKPTSAEEAYGQLYTDLVEAQCPLSLERAIAVDTEGKKKSSRGTKDETPLMIQCSGPTVVVVEFVSDENTVSQQVHDMLSDPQITKFEFAHDLETILALGVNTNQLQCCSL
jgi:hypothetical protein